MAYIFIFTCNIKFTSKHVGTFTYMKFFIYEIIYLICEKRCNIWIEEKSYVKLFRSHEIWHNKPERQNVHLKYQRPKKIIISYVNLVTFTLVNQFLCGLPWWRAFAQNFSISLLKHWQFKTLLTFISLPMQHQNFDYYILKRYSCYCMVSSAFCTR